MRILEQVKTFCCASRIFTDLLSNSPKHSLPSDFTYEGTEKMFFFFTKTPDMITNSKNPKNKQIKDPKINHELQTLVLVTDSG